MNLGVALGHATPIAIEATRWKVRFAASNARSKSRRTRGQHGSGHRRLKRSTQNIAPIRVDTELDEACRRPTRSAAHIHGTVNPEEAQAALADPHIAKVVDVFRGRIVDIRRSAGTVEA